MKIAILSAGPKIYSTRRLLEAAVARGHQCRIFNTLRFSMLVEETRPSLFYRGKSFPSYDAVIPRIGSSVTFYGTAVVRQFEQMGVFTLNPSHAISVSRDKLRSLQILSRHDIGLAPTSFVRERNQVLESIKQVGGAPVIIKVLEGTQGVGVILADTPKVAQAIIETLQMAKQNVLIQRFVEESKGRDIRAFVVGDRVVAAMQRTAQGDEFRSNVHRGGRAEPIDLSEDFERTAIHAAQILGLRVAGVDMLLSEKGPKILEVNSSPGLEGIEGATGVDVAAAIIEHIEELVEFPEVDVRQRLTLAKGYGVAEIVLAKSSNLIGSSIEKAQLRERDVVVLSIIRGSLTIPNPRVDRELLAGDVLVCFGRRDTLKSLFTPKRRRKKTKAREEETTRAPGVTDSSTESGPAPRCLGASEGEGQS